MNIIEDIKCECGTTFQWDATGKDEMEIRIYKPTRCDDCIDRIKAEVAAREARDEARRLEDKQWTIDRNKALVVSKLEEETPELFRRTDTNHPQFNSRAWATITNHRLSEEFPWIGFVGMTGRGKSRIAYLYAAQQIKRLTDVSIPSFAFVASYEISDAVGRQNGNDYEEKDKARDFLARLRKVDVLLIDDIGKGRLSPAVASELFALLNHRHAHLAITIWSSNTPPEVIAAGLPEDMAAPFARRLLGSSKIFTFK